MTHEELENYINTFQEHQREAVLKEILDSEILEKAFSTSEGKAVLSSAVDLITSDVIQIVRECVKPESEKDVKRYGNEINTVYKLMSEWAKILIRGSEHRNKIK
jgi:hypothetical protein